MSKCKNCKRDIDPLFLYCPWCGGEQLKKKNAVKLPKAVKISAASYRCQIMVDGQRVSVIKPTAKEAQLEAAAIRDGIKEVKTDHGKKKLTAAIDEFIADRQNTLSPSTIRGYRIIQRRWNSQCPGIRLCDLTQKYLQQHYDKLQKQLSRKTITNDLGFISTILTANNIEKPSIRLSTAIKNKGINYTKENIKTLCEAVKGSGSEIPVLLGLSSVTVSEMCAISWDNIDLKNRKITICGARLYDEHNKLVYKNSNKNINRQRTIPILMEQLYNALNAVEDKSGYLITVKPNTLNRRLHTICRDNNLPQISMHGLRHAFASLAASSEINLPGEVIQALGGWANDRVMKQVYTAAFAEDLSSGAAALSDWFNAPAKKKEKRKRKEKS